MTTREKMIRWGGPAAVAGGAAFLVTALMTVAIYVYKVLQGPVFEAHAFIHAFDAPTYLLLVVGLTGLYLLQKGRFGKVGKAGFFLTFLGFGLAFLASIAVIVVGLAVSDGATLGVLDALAHPLPMLLYMVGSLLFGIATYRAGLLPRLAAVMVAIGPVSLFLAFTAGLKEWEPLVPMFTIGLGWAWLGYSALSAREPARGEHDAEGDFAAEPAAR